jgi:L-lactate permease
MFHQLLTPVEGSLSLSALVALLPIAIVLVLLGILKKAAWLAAAAGLSVAFAIAVTVWAMPLRMARRFVHSIVLTLMLVVIVIIEQYVVPGIIPSVAGSR